MHSGEGNSVLGQLWGQKESGEIAQKQEYKCSDVLKARLAEGVNWAEHISAATNNRAEEWNEKQILSQNPEFKDT